MFEIIPPGIWLSKISVSTPVNFDSNSAYRGRTFAKWSLIFSSRSSSRRVVYGVPPSISTSASVGLWPGPSEIDEIEVSTMSAPASIAFIRLTRVTPVVAWQWTWTVSSSPGPP